MTGPLLLALTAGMLSAVNPCGFAMLPAYLSVLVTGGGVRRALACTAGLTLGYTLVFGAFGLVTAPLAGWLQPRLPWLTLALGVALVALGAWLLAGRHLPGLRAGTRAPTLIRSLPSMALFGAAYALASLSCTIAPFLAIVVASLRYSSTLAGVTLFLAYAAGMALVVGVTAVAVALVRTSLIARMRRVAEVVPRLGGAVLAVSGAYVAYYGWYEVRLTREVTTDPVVTAATRVQHAIAGLLSDAGVGVVAAIFAALLAVAWLTTRRSRPRRPAPPSPAAPTPSRAPSLRRSRTC